MAYNYVKQLNGNDAIEGKHRRLARGSPRLDQIGGKEDLRGFGCFKKKTNNELW